MPTSTTTGPPSPLGSRPQAPIAPRSARISAQLFLTRASAASAPPTVPSPSAPAPGLSAARPRVHSVSLALRVGKRLQTRKRAPKGVQERLGLLDGWIVPRLLDHVEWPPVALARRLGDPQPVHRVVAPPDQGRGNV